MYLMRKRIFAVLFFSVLLLYSVYNAVQAVPLLADEVREAMHAEDTSPQKVISALDDEMNETLTGRMDFIETYSYLQRLMDKREINNFAYIKDENGFLQYSSFFREDTSDTFAYSLRMKRLQDCAAANGTRVLFVVTPSKYIEGKVPIRAGLSPNDPAALTEQTLLAMHRMGIETLNLGEYMPNDELTYEQTYFKTDHHWTIPAAFAATQILVDTLNERFDALLDASCYLNREHYQEVTYPNSMLGYLGRKTGANFVGLEDFTALWPTFTVHYQRDCLEESGQMTHREGTTEQTLMIPETLTTNESIYKDSPYSLYLNGLRSYESIINEDNPAGPSVLMIRDSYFSPVITFMAPLCSRIDAIWSLEDSPQLDIEQYVRENRFDYIIMEVYPYNISDEAFQFFKEKD